MLQDSDSEFELGRTEIEPEEEPTKAKAAEQKLPTVNAKETPLAKRAKAAEPPKAKRV